MNAGDPNEAAERPERSAREERRRRARERRAGGGAGDADSETAAGDAADDEEKEGRQRRKPRGYEFTSTQNAVFSRLQLLMKITAAAQFAASLVACGSLWRPIQLLPWEVAAVLVAIVALPVLVGIWTFRAAAHFRSIVDTKGADIDHLMRALGELQKLYMLQVGLFALALLLASVMFVVGWDAQPRGGPLPTMHPGQTFPSR